MSPRATHLAVLALMSAALTSSVDAHALLGGGSARTAEAGITVLGAGGAVWRRLTAQPGHRGLDWAAP